MILNRATDYAFRAVLYLSLLPAGQVVEGKTISEDERIPMRFVLKILRTLSQAGIVRSHRGVKGGYSLARPPAEITMLDVIEAMEGPVRLNRCLISPEECNKRFTSKCPVHRALYAAQQALRDQFRRYNFEMLAAPPSGSPPDKLPTGSGPSAGRP
ncbi:MAG: Rrf2 family transcriptional regulator [Bacillota bacterium]|nr:Rrf2 family transcriptional regulator [Bacillota bacterium]